MCELSVYIYNIHTSARAKEWLFLESDMFTKILLSLFVNVYRACLNKVLI